jgi:hypothetical protein
MRSALIVCALACVLAACGSQPMVVNGEAGTAPYDGPMSLKRDYSDDAGVVARSGAAGHALECAGAPYDGGGGDYADGGLESVQDGAEEALANYFDEEGFGRSLPVEGYRVERRDGDRVLLSYDVGGRTKVAFVVADGISDWKHHTGWGVEGWAQCDPAELPEAFTDHLDLQVWTDAAGARVPVTQVVSFPGAEHCDWQDITFLRLGDDPTGVDRDRLEEYLRDTTGELRQLESSAFSDHAQLPADAKDSGWHHDGRELWRVPDRSAAYLVSLDDDTDVERWPASTEPVGCD